MTKPSIEINLTTQKLILRLAHDAYEQYGISSAANGPGEKMDSERTPRGQHVVDEKIGGGCERNTVFVGRRPTGEIYNRKLREENPDRDWILTRILWLRGLEEGRNCGGEVDSKARYIYIHGTPEDTNMLEPGSRGCVRMANSDVERLFDQVDVGTVVTIFE